MSDRRILVIGYGAIAADLVADLGADGATVCGVFLRPGSASRDKVPGGITVCETIEEIAAFGPDLVVEAAGHEAVREIVPECLARGLPVLIASIGALHDEPLKARLVAKAREGGGRLVLASGALGGLDYVRAVRPAAELDLAYESRKPPAAWARELQALGHDPETLEEPVTLFEGTARQAAASYPQNLNVAAALALAGSGFETTRVSVICDPRAKGNTHIVRSTSEYGEMHLSIVNRPSPTNPKSSWIVARALLAAIEQHFAPIVML